MARTSLTKQGEDRPAFERDTGGLKRRRRGMPSRPHPNQDCWAKRYGLPPLHSVQRLSISPACLFFCIEVDSPRSRQVLEVAVPVRTLALGPIAPCISPATCRDA